MDGEIELLLFQAELIYFKIAWLLINEEAKVGNNNIEYVTINLNLYLFFYK